MKTRILFGLVLLPMVGVAGMQAQRLTLQDIVSAEPIGETVLSPDGKTFAVPRRGQIALMPATGGWPVPVTSTMGGKSSRLRGPRMARRLRMRAGGSIWVVSAAGGGAPKRLTNAPPGGR